MGAVSTFAQSNGCESTAERPDGRWRQGDTERAQETASRTCRASRRTPLYSRRIAYELSTPTGLHLHEWPGSALAQSLHPGPTVHSLMQPYLDRPSTGNISGLQKYCYTTSTNSYPAPNAHPLEPSRQLAVLHPPLTWGQLRSYV